MRKAQKNQIEQTLSLMRKAHEEIRKQLGDQNREIAMQLLSDCQEGAIQAGNLIEQTEGEDAPSIREIEAYCETCYRLYEEAAAEQEQNASGVYRLLQKMLTAVENSVRHTIPVRLEIAFFCYKASMSDSLESIYFAAKEDPSCDAYFIPIPYYDKNPNGSFGQMHYEAEGCYPDAYELVDWKKYNVEVRRPDIIYIMNPYDDRNLVTSVHPDFYAGRLRDLTDCLVYVPYNISPVAPRPEKSAAPGVLFSDLMFVQSDYIRDVYIENFLKQNDIEGLTRKVALEKIKSMGSPKLDKLVNADREDYVLPEEWQKIIAFREEGKKIILYNLTIGRMLGESLNGDSLYLKKLRSVLEFFKKRRDIALWLRPHPLLQQTFDTMRPQLAGEYRKLTEEYRNEGWGIYDDTPDMNRAIVWADAVYGDRASLGVLAEFLGKPVLLQNMENAGSEPEAAGSREGVRKAMEVFVSKDEFNSYVMEEAERATEESRFSMADFFGHMDVILEYRAGQMKKFRERFANPDGTAGRKIHEYTTALLRKTRGE